MNFFEKIRRKWMKWRWEPIRVFCFHQVSEQYDAQIYCQPDWMATKDLKQRIYSIREAGYTFISLQDAYMHIKNDKFRRKKYAVLTCDDGLKCQATLIPWLEEQQIPLTMFVTAKNLDGKTCGEQIIRYFNIEDKEEECKLAEQLYLTAEELEQIDNPLVEIGMHGYEHIEYPLKDEAIFGHHVQLAKEVLQKHPMYIPFFAYPFGSRTLKTDAILSDAHIVPVYVDGSDNINDAKCIHREIL